MDEDPRTTPADKAWVALIRDLIRRRKWTYALFFGATAGMVVGVLNLSVAAREWKPAEFFDTMDCPVTWLGDTVKQRFGFFAGKSEDVHAFCLLVAIICYWTLIGLFLGWLFCVIRRYGFTGIAKGIAHDRICRSVLFYGTVGGMLIGCLNFAAGINGWKIEDSFEAFSRPAIAVIEAVHDRIIFSYNLPGSSGMGVLYCVAAVIIPVYWAIIGFFFASLFGFMRIVRKKSGATDTRMSAECLSGQSEINP